MPKLISCLCLCTFIALIGCAEDGNSPENNPPVDNNETIEDTPEPQEEEAPEEVDADNNPDEEETNIDEEVEPEVEEEEPCEGPIAILKLNDCGPGNSTNCNNGAPTPLERLYLDGSSSHDPNGGLIATYEFEVTELPAAANPNDFHWEANGTAQPSLWLPMAGYYRICLRVRNDLGIESCETDQSCLSIQAATDYSMHIQLTWDHPSSDQDLHLVHASAGGHYCSEELDCNYSHKQPHWFPEYDQGEGPNPRLDIDDTNGLGPEHITIEEPLPGVYRVFAARYPWSAQNKPITSTVKVYINGVLRFDHQRTTTQDNSIWAAADITWIDDGSSTGYAEVVPFLGKSENGEIGRIGILNSKDCDTPDGWIFPTDE